MIVTTSQAPAQELLAYAEALAKELNAPFIHRREMSVRKLMARYGGAHILVATEQELRLYERDSMDKPLVYHPSMALPKLKGMLQGNEEALIRYSGCQPGDVVLDCTAGLCSDSLVFSLAAGADGKVIALESEQLLYIVVREGLAQYKVNVQEIEQAMRRIELKLADHERYLASLPDNSVDIVYFDPMFRQPLHESSAIGAIRSMANKHALTELTIAEAKRVARKCVMLKEHSMSEEFERLGFTRCQEARGQRIAYGVIARSHNK